MMEIDNFAIIGKFLRFPLPKNQFYLIQIIQRRKDFPEGKLNKNHRMIKSFYIYSEDELKASSEFIKDTCRKLNARAYLTLNPRDSEQITLLAIQELARYAQSNSTKASTSVIDHCIGISGTIGEKLWVVDIDTKDEDYILQVCKSINFCNSEFLPIILGRIPTKNGCHLITHPFNMWQFDMLGSFDKADIKRDARTLLFYGNSENCSNSSE